MKYPILIGIILLALGVILWKPIKESLRLGSVKSAQDEYEQLKEDVDSSKQEAPQLDDELKSRIIDQIIGEAIQFGDVEKLYDKALLRLDEASRSTNPQPSASQSERITLLRARYEKLLAQQPPASLLPPQQSPNNTTPSKSQPKDPDKQTQDATKTDTPKSTQKNTVSSSLKAPKLQKNNKKLSKERPRRAKKVRKTSQSNKEKKSSIYPMSGEGEADSLLMKAPVELEDDGLERDLEKGVESRVLEALPNDGGEDVSKEGTVAEGEDSGDEVEGVQEESGAVVESGSVLGVYQGKSAQDLYMKGKRELDAGRYDDSIELFDQVLQLNSGHGLSHSYKGTAFLKKREYNNALRSANKALEVDPQDVNAFLTKGEVFYAQSRNLEAEVEFQNYIAHNQQNGLVYFKLGVLKLLANENEDALKFFIQALAVKNSLEKEYRYKAYYNRGISKERLGQLDSAEDDYNQALKINPRHHKSHVHLSQLQYKRQNYPQAIEKLRELSVQLPDVFSEDYVSYFLMAQSYSRLANQNQDAQGSYENALEFYKKSLQIQPDNLYALVNVACIALRFKNYQLALDYFEKAQNVDAKNYSVLCGLGAAHFYLKNYEQSLHFYKKAKDINNKGFEANLGLAATSYAKLHKAILWEASASDLENTIKALESFYAFAPDRFDLNQALGVTYFYSEQKAKAIPFLVKSLERDTSNLEARYNLASAYFVTQQFDQALVHYKALITAGRNEPEVYIRIAESYYKLNDHKNAHKWLLQVVERFSSLRKDEKVQLYLAALEKQLAS